MRKINFVFWLHINVKIQMPRLNVYLNSYSPFALPEYWWLVSLDLVKLLLIVIGVTGVAGVRCVFTVPYKSPRSNTILSLSWLLLLLLRSFNVCAVFGFEFNSVGDFGCCCCCNCIDSLSVNRFIRLTFALFSWPTTRFDTNIIAIATWTTLKPEFRGFIFRVVVNSTQLNDVHLLQLIHCESIYLVYCLKTKRIKQKKTNEEHQKKQQKNGNAITFTPTNSFKSLTSIEIDIWSQCFLMTLTTEICIHF